MMSKSVSKKKIYQVLEKVNHPEIKNHNLVELGMISDVDLNDISIRVTLALPSLDVSIKNELIVLVEEAIEKNAYCQEVEIEVVEMDADQRAAFASMVKQVQFKEPGGQIGKVIAVMSGKGGVGKSSVAGLLAASLRRRRYPVGLLDADITGPSIPKMFGATQRPENGTNGMKPVLSKSGIGLMSINLLLPDRDQPVIWRGPLISRAIEQFWSDIAWGNLDFLIVDLPPGTADAALTVMQSLPLDGIVLVTSPQDLAGMVVRKAANMAKKIGVPLIGLVENMSHVICPECGAQIDVFGESKAENTARLIDAPILGHLPIDPQLAELCDRGDIEEYGSEIFEEIAMQVHRVVAGKEYQRNQ